MGKIDHRLIIILIINKVEYQATVVVMSNQVQSWAAVREFIRPFAAIHAEFLSMKVRPRNHCSKSAFRIIKYREET